MLRRSLATLILSVSLFVGTLAWSGFVALRTVLDADRSQAVAEELYDDPMVRDQLAKNIATAVGATIADDVPISQAQLNTAAKAALDSPAIEVLVVDAFVATHRAFLGEGEAPESLDAGAFGAAARDALVAQQPALDAVLPPSPQFEVPLPTDRVPNAGPIRDFLERAVPVLALVSTVGILFALVATSDRPAVLRRAGFWAIGASALFLVFAFGVPWAGRQFAPDQSAVIATIVGSLAATTRGPALAMAMAGAAAIGVAVVWKRAPRRSAPPPARPAATMPPPPLPLPAHPPHARRGGRAVRRDMPAGPRVTRFEAGPRAAPPMAAAPTAASPPPSPTPTAVQPPPTAPPSQEASSPPPLPAPSATTGRPPVYARHVEEHGWVIDSASRRVPSDARWVPGVGYVVDHPPER